MVLRDFFETIVDDPRIGSSHIVIYLALIYLWEEQGRGVPLEVDSVIVMRFAKLRKRDTYLLRVKELAEFGYIRYRPAENAYIKAEIIFRKL